MKIVKGYKVELDLNNRQKTECAKHAGAARWAYNWGLNRKKEHYEQTGKSIGAMDLHKELNQLKKTIVPWMYEVSKCAAQEALRNLDKAFKGFFDSVTGKRKGEAVGFPKFKSRRHGLGSFRLTGVIKVEANRVKLPRLGWSRLKESGYIPVEDMHILSATVSEKSGRWFVSVQVEEEIPDPQPATGTPIGVDLGIKTMATCSDRTTFDNPKALYAKTKQLERWQRRLSRRVKGSQNWYKAKQKVAQLHMDVANLRKDAIHKATSAIIGKQPSHIAIENLNVKGMVKNHKLAKAVSDVGMGEFGRQIKYKAKWNGIEVIEADRFFPSSKTCSGCGIVKDELPLSARTYNCDDCGLSIDRDLNAAVNLRQLAPV